MVSETDRAVARSMPSIDRIAPRRAPSRWVGSALTATGTDNRLAGKVVAPPHHAYRDVRA